MLSIAPDAFEVVRTIVPNAAAAIFLTDDHGVVQRCLHDDAPLEIQSLFRFQPELFAGPGECSVVHLVGTHGTPKVGQLLRPPEGFFKSNTYQILVRGSGHRHTLDARLEVGGRRAGLIALYREAGRGFSAADAQLLAKVAALFEHALGATVPSLNPLDAAASAEDDEAVVVCDGRGRPVHVSARASAAFASLGLTRERWPDRQTLPTFCHRLIASLCNPEPPPGGLPEVVLPASGGLLRARAQWLTPPADAAVTPLVASSGDGLAAITLQRHTPLAMRVWRRIGERALSPQQSEVAFWLALRGRDHARDHLGLGEAVLKDCVRALLTAFDCTSQQQLIGALRYGAA